MQIPPPAAFAATAPPADLCCSLLEIGGAVVAVLRYSRARRREREALTAAEQAVMKAIFDGKSNDAIARDRGTSPRTIANQIASIFRKHGVCSRRELVALYLGRAT